MMHIYSCWLKAFSYGYKCGEIVGLFQLKYTIISQYNNDGYDVGLFV